MAIDNKVIIIGGGISGIGCARTLHEKNIPFVLITENIGGRILFSRDGVASFGPWYARKDYHYVRPFINLIRKVGYLDITFHKRKSVYHMFGLHFFLHPIQAIKTIAAVNRYKKEYFAFKKLALHKSQKEIIDSNPYLKEVHEKNAADFIREHNIEDFANDFLGEVLYGTTFAKITEMSAATFLHFSLPLIIPAYRFSFDKEKALSGIRDNISLDSVTEINKIDNLWHISTRLGSYKAKYLVVSTPPEVAKKLLPITFDKKGASIYMFYVKGKLKSFWNKGNEELFDQESNVVGISREAKDSYLFCSKNSKPDFEKYFERFEVKEMKIWDPAFHTIGNQVFETNPGGNLYITGDYNYPNIEDSYITGIYAANKIADSLKLEI